MLKLAYSSIKRINNNIIVISAALAPTFVEAGFLSQVVNDDRYLREMVAAGAMQYLDCLGIDYVNGLRPPGETAGDPRHEHFTAYFQGMLNLYYHTIGGDKPLCFTGLGYLSGEGYDPLPQSLTWGANITAAEQGAWLAEAVQMAYQSGRVQLVIIFSIDAFARANGNDDPLKGYAIVRPGGNCPACYALGSLNLN